MKVVKYLNIEIPFENTTKIFEAIKKSVNNLKKDGFDIVFSDTDPTYEHIEGSTKKGVSSFEIIICQKFKKKETVLKWKPFFLGRTKEEVAVDMVRAPFFYFSVDEDNPKNRRLEVKLIKGFSLDGSFFYKDDAPADTEFVAKAVIDLLTYRVSYYTEKEAKEVMSVFNRLSEGIVENLK